MKPTASIGFRVKTGRAIAVVLRGPASSPSVWKRQELILADLKRPEMWQPYHEVLDLPWEEAQAAVQKTAQAIQATAARSIQRLVEEIRAAGLEVHGAALVSGSAQDPGRISNPHIRAHAAEGKLFREAVETGAKACGLASRAFSENEVYAKAASELNDSEVAVKQRVSQFAGKQVKPWRTEEKMAAAAAWMVLVK